MHLPVVFFLGKMSICSLQVSLLVMWGFWANELKMVYT